MGNKIINYLFALIFILGINNYAQEKVMVTLNVFQPLPEVSFAAFLTNPHLESTPRILQVIMSPHKVKVVVQGSVLWRKVGESSFNELYNYTTKPFLSKNFFNNDFSSFTGITIEESSSNNNLLQENLEQGKPTGTYKLVFDVKTLSSGEITHVEENIDFLNPSQTLVIIQPNIEARLDVAGIQLTWSEVTGVSEYIVKANIRENNDESLEEALQKGNPIINNKKVGLRTSINFRKILDRELVGGEEVVVQIRASIDGPEGPTFIASNIVNFYINSSGTPPVDKGVDDFKALIIDVLDVWKSEGQVDTEAYKKLIDLLDSLESGNLSFNDIKIKTKKGRRLTYTEFQKILKKLRRNPDLITKISFEEK